MYQMILFVHVVIAIAIIALVLMQHGKGADIGAAFGSGASQTVFGSQGSGSFLLKLTGFLGAAFFATSLTLGYIAAYQYKHGQQLTLPFTQSQQVPAKQKTQSNTNNNSSKAETKTKQN